MPTLATFRFPAFACAAAVAAGLLFSGCATTPRQVQRMAAPGGDAAAEKIAPHIYTSNTAVRRTALDELAKMPESNTANDALFNATLSPNPVIRGDAGAALVFHPQPDVEFYAITLLADRDPRVRVRMAEGLSAAGRAGPAERTRRASVYLWGLLQDDDPAVRAAAVQGLGSLGLNDPITFSLESLANDPDPRVRAAAARGLGALARAYLAGESGPDWRDAVVAEYVAGLTGRAATTPTRARGEEIVAALCKSASTDSGTYVEIVFESESVSGAPREQTRAVAVVAAESLTVSGATPRADVAKAIAAADAFAPAAPAPPTPRPPPARSLAWQPTRT